MMLTTHPIGIQTKFFDSFKYFNIQDGASVFLSRGDVQVSIIKH